jgi:hypothetical protein
MANTETNPLDGPFMTSAQLTDYSDAPGYAIRPQPQPVLEARLAVVREALAAAGVPEPLARRRAMGIYSDWLDSVAGRHTSLTLAQFADSMAGQ